MKELIMDKLLSVGRIYDFLDKFQYELNDQEQETLISIFNNADTHYYNGTQKELDNGETECDYIIDKSEYANFKTNLLQKIKGQFRGICSMFFKTFESENSDTNILANNILVTKDSFDTLIGQQCLQNLNSDNLFQVLDEYYKVNKSGRLFKELAEHCIVMAMTEDESSISIAKANYKKLVPLVINYAKSNNIYTKDYEKRINDAIANDDYQEVGVSMDRLYTRIALALNKSSEITVNNRKMELIEPNGKIDANFAQGSTGDCWFLSAIRAVTNNEQGLEKLNNMITINRNNGEVSSVSVKIQGKIYEINYDDLKYANEYATGDLDVRALEIAVDRYLRENGLDDISTGRPSFSGFKYLFGEDSIEVEEFDEINDKFLNTIAKGNQMATIGTHDELTAIDDNGEEVKTRFGHVLIPIGIEDNYVVFYDPWNSGKRLRIDKEIFAYSDSSASLVHFKNT